MASPFPSFGPIGGGCKTLLAKPVHGAGSRRSCQAAWRGRREDLVVKSSIAVFHTYLWLSCLKALCSTCRLDTWFKHRVLYPLAQSGLLRASFCCLRESPCFSRAEPSWLAVKCKRPPGLEPIPSSFARSLDQSRGRLGGGIFLTDGSTPQISWAYSMMVLSLENLPEHAMFLMTFLVHS